MCSLKELKTYILRGHNCPHGDDSGLPFSQWTYCGSNFDALGNARFDRNTAIKETFFLNFGYSLCNFDNLGSATLLVFQSMTGAGYSDLMYMNQDAFGRVGGSIYFSLILVVGTFFILQLVLAIMHSAMEQQRENEKSEKRKMAKRKMVASSIQDLDIDALDGGVVVEKRSDYLKFLDKVFYYDRPSHNSVRKGFYETLVTMMILTNTVVLAMDRFPLDANTSNSLDAANFLLTLGFVLDFAVSLFAEGFKRYFSTNFNILDSAVVIISLVDLAITPIPVIFTRSASASVAKYGSMSSLRSFRLFRLFRLIRSKEFRFLFSKILKAVVTMESFFILLFLYIYIMTLIGSQFFANRFRFDDQGAAIKELNSHQWAAAPCNHFSNYYAR